MKKLLDLDVAEAYGWELVDVKSVVDSNDRLTDYALWYNVNTGEWVTIIGNVNVFDPLNAEPDAVFDYEDDAYDWFNTYLGYYRD